MADKSVIGARLREFAIRDYGSVAELERFMGVSKNGLSTYISGRTGVGSKLQERLRKAGCDIEWLMTGKKKEEELKFPDNVLVSYGAEPDPEVLKRIHKLAVWMSKASKEDAKMLEEVARKILNVDDNEEV